MLHYLISSCLLQIWFLFILQSKENYSLIIKPFVPKKRFVTFGLRVDEKFGKGLPGFNYTNEEMLKFKIWPNGIIPYFIDDFSFDKVLRDRIRAFLDRMHIRTGIQFDELKNPPEGDTTRWVLFLNRRGVLNCVDYTTKNFTNDGVQKVVFGYDCLVSDGAMAATILPLIGVPAQHNAPDRAKYITINEENILPDKKHLFEAVTNEDWLFHDIKYDWESAGHFDFYKYTQNGASTIVPKMKVEVPVGEANELSISDIKKIRSLYNYIREKRRDKFTKCSQLYEPAAGFANFTQNVPWLQAKEIPKVTILPKLSEETIDRMPHSKYNEKRHRNVEKNQMYLQIKNKSDYNTEENK